MVVTHNIEANFTERQIGIKNRALNKNTEKLTSGYRVNRAADDASGLAISEGMRGQVRGLSRSALNTDEGTSYCQIADGAMQEIENIVHRMRELSVQAADDVNTPKDREMIQFEIDQLVVEIDRIAENTEYNTMKIFAGDPENRDGKNYGLSNILGTGNVYQGKNMDSPIRLTGPGWNATGPTGLNSNGAWIDFSGLGSAYSLSSLEKQGFTTGCGHCGGAKRYAVEFTMSDCQTTNADGVNYTFSASVTLTWQTRW